MDGATIFERLDRIGDDLAELTGTFDAGLFDGRQAKRVVCAAADIERLAVTLKTLAMRRVDETGAWRSDGSRSPGKWLAHKTGTSLSDAYGTVELAEQLDQLPEVTDAARRGDLSPLQTKMIAGAASKDPASERLLVGVAKRGSVGTLRNECAAARQRGAGADAMARIHERRRFRDWTDPDGAYRYEGTMTPDKGARFKSVLAGFTDQVFGDARRAGVRDTHEQYAADALVRMAEAALTNTTTPTSETDEPPAPSTPAYTRSRVQVVLIADAAAWVRDYLLPGETCEIAGLGPIDIATAKRMAGDAIVDIVLTHGVDVRTLAHARHGVTRTQYAALLAEGYACNVDGCGNTRYLEIDHLGDGWATNGITVNGDLAWKCPHCHDLKTYKHWTDGPQQPNGKRTLNPPTKPPPPDTG